MIGLGRPTAAKTFALAFTLLLTTLAFSASASASAATTPAPGWTLDSVAAPTNFFPSSHNAACGESFQRANIECDTYEVVATNAGGAPSDGGPVTLSDTLPTGPNGEKLVEVHQVQLFVTTNVNTTRSQGTKIGGIDDEVIGSCSPTVVAGAVSCEFAGTFDGTLENEALRPDTALVMKVYVTVNEGVAEATKLTNRAAVSGGGAPPISTESHNEVSSAAAPFGAERFEFYKAGLNGSQETQAGGHPYELTTTIDLNDTFRITPGQGPKEGPYTPGDGTGETTDVQDVRDVVVDLPLGFAGSTLAAPECTEAQLGSEAHCPPDTVVGHLTTEPAGPGTDVNGPIWNLAPERGHPAEFGYVDTLKGTHIAGFVSVVPTPQGYVLRFVSSEIPEVILHRITVTFYGDPALRDAETQQLQFEKELGRAVPLQVPTLQVPFFTNPTACSNGPQVARLWIDSWSHPGQWSEGGKLSSTSNGPTSEPVLTSPGWVQDSSQSPPVTGCNKLTFTPELEVQPTTHEADKPTGLTFGLKLPQTENVNLAATPALKNIRVTFPAGMTVDPSSADGLDTCTNAEIGYEGPTLFDFSQEKPECPENSKIGELELETPEIPGVLHGEMFLAAQNENPFHSTFATYVVVNDPVTGVVLKIAGELKLNPSTGQITAIFNENPQLPFSNLKLHFFGGPRAELATPAGCGIYTTNSEQEPWSFETGDPLSTPFDSFTIDEDCQTGFSPDFTALSSNVQAGAYSSFEASFSRQDDEPELGGATINLPPGMLANVSSVTECSEAQLQAEREDVPGGCPESSKVGTTTAGAGPGPNPLFVGGNVYWTGPYNGHGACTPGVEAECAPFGLAVVVSANPGPFHFGNVVVRQRLFINKETASATDVSDPFPTFLHVVAPNGETNGIPIKLRRVDVDINRPGFTFNPTNCARATVGGAITSTHGESSTLASPFQTGGCRELKFEPKFSVSVTGKNTKEGGSALTAKVTEPNVPQGTDAGIHSVKVELPVQLPSRLSTLQRACTDKQFNEDPANCPKESKIGMAVVHTPILPEPLIGPAIFVSHGGEAFPSLTLVLQGDGVTIDLVGTTFISSKSITSTTFKAVPDTPFSTFELTLPQGKYSALGTNVPEKDKYNLCGQKLVMPNEFIGQNGAEIHQDTAISVTGCKPEIRVVSHKVKGKTATIVVSVPAAGKLVASGKGVSKGTGKASKAQDVTVKVSLSNKELAFLAKHHRKHEKVEVKLAFSPKKGARLSTSVTVSVG
jgi:hypothetical protein